ncbi:MAG: hypothetical protein II567_00455 [Candidatus Riflebacteria bacterium]|nr:hypothetical protein [Candidatus Riflebacteria bacterium]
MKKINNIFTIVFIGLLILQSNCSLEAAKKSSKTSNKQQSQQKNDASSDSSVIYVFPVDADKKPFKPVKRVLTGIFTEKQQSKAVAEEKEKNSEGGKLQRKEIPPRKLNEKTIAWVNTNSIYYHDPYNNCLNIKERSWAEDKKELLGLEPCPDCFKKLNKTPEFIKKESAAFDVADSDKLLLNADFIEWIKKRFPVEDMNFISGTKLLAYPNLDMTSKGMHQLAIEIQNAYLRQTWRVIEVIVKSKPDVVPYVSSFSPTSELLGVTKNKLTDNDDKNKNYKEPKKPRLFQ